MSYWYWRALKKDWTLNEGTTNKFSFPERGMLSGLAIHSIAVNNLNLDTYDRPYPIQRHTKLRVVGNGNFEIINAKGTQLQALDCWNRNSDPSGLYSQIDTHYQRNYFLLPFGRFMGDPLLGLDLSKFAAGVEFEETNDYSTTYHTDTYQKMDIYGLFRKTPEAGLFSGGFLKKRQIINKDAATETQYAVKLPTTAKLRQISLFTEGDVASGVETGNPMYTANYVWLGIKSKEEYLLQNMRVREFAYWIHDIMGRKFTTDVTIHSGTGGLSYADTMLYRSKLISGIAHYGEAADIFLMTLGGDTRIKRVYAMIAGTATEGAMGEVVSKGVALHGHVPLLLQEPNSEPEEWLDSKELADVYVEVTEGHSTGNWYIVLDELEDTYPS